MKDIKRIEMLGNSHIITDEVYLYDPESAPFKVKSHIKLDTPESAHIAHHEHITDKFKVVDRHKYTEIFRFISVKIAIDEFSVIVSPLLVLLDQERFDIPLMFVPRQHNFYVEFTITIPIAIPTYFRYYMPSVYKHKSL